MGWFKKFEVTGYKRGWNTETQEYEKYPIGYDKTTILGKLTIFASILAAGYLTVSDKYVDIFGDSPKEVPVEVAKPLAQTKYDAAFSKASPAAKFMLQYGAVTHVEVNKYVGGNGIAGAVGGGDDYGVSFNNACLNDTAYDINGGTIDGHFYSLFSGGSAHGDVPTAAAFAETDPSNPNRLIVKSGHANSVDLTFTGLQSASELTPADDATRNVLDTYGCRTGMQHIGTTYYSYDSDYIK